MEAIRAAAGAISGSRGRGEGESMNKKGNKTFVEPLRDVSDIKAISAELLEGDKEAGQFAFVVWSICIYTGFRIGDVLRLKVNNISGARKEVRKHIRVKEQKTRKHKEEPRTIAINPELKPILQEYINGLDWKGGVKGESYLFPSPRKEGKHISYQWFMNRLKDAAAAAGIDQRITAHTARKTYAYTWWIANRDNRTEYPTRADAKEKLSKDILRHEKLAHTERYICIDQDELDRATNTVSYK